jgi:amino acid permease
VGHAIHWTATTPAPTRLGDWLALLVGAWLALLVHLCASAAATWPSAAPMPRPALLRWGRRTATVALATVPVWGVSMLTRDQSLRGEVSMTYVALAALTLLCGALYAMARQAPRTRR